MSRIVNRLLAAAAGLAGAAVPAAAQCPTGPVAGPDCLTAPAYPPGVGGQPSYNPTPGYANPGYGSPTGSQPGSVPLSAGQGGAGGAGGGGDFASRFGGQTGGAGVGETASLGASSGAYIENAVPVTMFRLRYSSMYGNNRPDRAEFFYAKCGCFRNAPLPLRDRNANGPPLEETNVDSQELVPYLEYALNPRLSVFGDIPIRFLNPDRNRNSSGLSDVSFGAKYAFISNAARVWSAQVRAIAPSGSAGDGLGTGNWWLEPGVLFLEQLSCRWQLFGQVTDRIPLSPRNDFTGNVLQYGLGTAYYAYQGPRGYVAPVVEFVGWTVLGGREFAFPEGLNKSAYGDTIVNAKFGVRFGFGDATGPYGRANDVYIGYGRALTGEVWYKDILRVEYRRFF